jgi:large subunit ribosomal protein L2
MAVNSANFFTKLKVFNSLRVKRLFKSKQRFFGRSGRITVRHIGGGAKRLFRLVDVRRGLMGCTGLVVGFCYDPFRSASLMLVYYCSFGLFSFMLRVEGVLVGDKIYSYPFCNDTSRKGVRRGGVVDFKKRAGSVFRLCDIPIGLRVCNIESLGSGSAGGSIARAVGAYGTINRKVDSGAFVGIQLPSDKNIFLNGNSLATLGKISSIGVRRRTYKAGINRCMGVRPSVRGVAMNPIDHPHGGGEGKTSGGRISVSPWGKLAKGGSTRSYNKKRAEKVFVRRVNRLSGFRARR